MNAFDIEYSCCVVVLEFRVEFVAALRDDADTSPAAIGSTKNASDHLLRLGISFAAYGASIRIFEFGAALLELAHGHQDALQNIDGLKTCYDDRYLIVCHQRLVFFPAHHGANVAGPEKP